MSQKPQNQQFGTQRLLEIVISFILAMVSIGWYFNEKKDFENLGLGEGTKSYFATDGTYPIHLSKIDKINHDSIILGWKNRGHKDVIFCLGNSQTHGINQIQEGHINYPELLYNHYKDSDYDVLTNSIPNCNFQEYYLLTEFWIKHLPIKYLLLPAFMDDTRENDIHDFYFPYLISTQYQAAGNNDLSDKINHSLSGASKQTSEDMSALDKTVQEKSEVFLNNWLKDNFYPWNNRPTARGEFFYWLYTSRNTAFGISAQSKRKVIVNAYNNNLNALEHIFKLSEKNNIKVITYIPPIRNDVEVPYILSEYDNFKTTIENKCNNYSNIEFLNLETIVPAKYWGTKGSTNLTGELELDFMHFQYQGHVELYNALKPEIDKLISEGNDI